MAVLLDAAADGASRRSSASADVRHTGAMLANPVTYSFGDSAATWVSVVLALALEIRVVLWWLRDRGGPSRWLLALVVTNTITWPLLALCIGWLDLRNATQSVKLGTLGALEVGVVLVEAAVIVLLGRWRSAACGDRRSVGIPLAVWASLMGNLTSVVSAFLIFVSTAPAFIAIGW